MRRILHFLGRPFLFPLFLLLIALVTYGFYLGRMGFYWDDWMPLFMNHLGDPSLFWQFYIYDRPVSAWTYLATFPLLGDSAAVWQLFTILMRWLTSIGMWFALRGVWPRRTAEVSWMALLLLVYPGFTQQSISVAYSQHFFTYALLTGSLALTVFSLRRRRWFWPLTILAALTSLLQLLTMEYYAGLELLRPLLIFFMLQEMEPTVRARLPRLFKVWWPYGLALAVFAVFRFVVYPRISPDPGSNAPVLLLNWLKDPLNQSVHFFEIVLQDVTHMLVFPWVKPLEPALIDLTYKFWLFSWAVGAILAIGAAVYLVSISRNETLSSEGNSSSFTAQAVYLGGLGILLGGLPVWITDRQAIVGLWSDRFLLAPMFGVVILVVALIQWVGRSALQRSAVLAVLLAISIGAQMRTVDNYRRSWVTQREYFWQMVWRIPALAPGTTILSTSLPFLETSDYSMSYAVNMIYAPDLTAANLPYLYLSAPRYRNGLLNNYARDSSFTFKDRSVRFEGSTSRAIVVDQQDGNACFRVLTQQDTLDPKLEREEADLVALSNLDRMASSADPRSILSTPFDPEPAHTWCYYYEKGDLARQEGDWQTAAALYAGAEASGYKTKYGWELQPFIEAGAMTGDWAQAQQLSTAAAHMTASMEPALCNLWQRIRQAAPASAEKEAALSWARGAFSCQNW